MDDKTDTFAPLRKMANTVDVIANDDYIRRARFSVPVGTRKEIEAAIEEKLRSGEVVWNGVSHGVNVVCFHKDNVWRPRARFTVNNGNESADDGEE
jgi:hypothetical protein